MDVTNGQHKWWKGKEMRRLERRSKRHNYHNKNYKKTKLKSGCPVSVPAMLPPCPAKLTAAKRGRRSPHKKGSGKFRKQDFSSSEEDVGWFARFRKPKKAARKTAAPKNCIDSKTRKTSSYYPGGTYSTKTTPYSTTYNGDREEIEDEEENSASSETFTINTTPIIDIRNIEISASRTIYSETASMLSVISSERIPVSPIQSSVSSPTTTSSQTFTASSLATVGLNELLNAGGGRRDSSLVMNEQPSAAVRSSAQWRSSITDGAASMSTSAISTAESIAPTSTWKNSVSSARGDSSLSAGGSLDDIIRGNNNVKSSIAPSLSSEWSGGSSQIDALGSRLGSIPKFEEKTALPFTKTTPLVENTQNRDSSTGKNAFTEQTILPTVILAETKTSPSTTTTPTTTTTSTTATSTTTTTSKPSTASETTSASTRRRWEPISKDKKEVAENEDTLSPSLKNTGSTGSIEVTRTWKSDLPSRGGLDEILRNDAPGAKSSISSAATTVVSSKTVEESRKVPNLDDLLRSKSSNDNSNKGNSDDALKNTWIPIFFSAVTVPEQSKPPPFIIPKFDSQNLITNNNVVTFPNVVFTLHPDLFTKKSTEQTNTPQNPLDNLPKFDTNNIFTNTRMTTPAFSFQTVNLDYLVKKVTSEQTESPKVNNVPQIDEKLLWAHTKTTSTSANVGTSKNQKASPQLPQTATTLTDVETTSASETTLSHRSRGRGDLISNEKKETPENVAEITKTAEIKLNDLLTTRMDLELRTTKIIPSVDNNVQSTSAKTVGTTKISLLDLVTSAGQEKSVSTINPLNQLYTTRNSLLDQSPSARVSSEENSKNDKRTEESVKWSTIKEVVTENGRSSATYSTVVEPIGSQGPSTNNNKAKSEASSATDSNQRTTRAPNLIELIAASGPAVDNKKGEADDKNKSPLNDLLGAKSVSPNGKEITFSDKSVTASDTKYQPPPPTSEASNNFHKASADATPPPAKTINPPGSVNNLEQRGNEKTPAADKRGLNDLVATEKVVAASEATRLPLPQSSRGAETAGANPLTPAEAKEDEHHRKYVFYLMFGSSNCNVCPGAAPPKVTVNRISGSANDTGDIKWADSAGSLSDGEGGTFFIGFRKGPGKAAGDKIIQPMLEIKMDKEERACNSIYSSFFK